MALTACQSAVMNPRGPVGLADRTILVDSLAIMLAIVVPTILATLGIAQYTQAQFMQALAAAGYKAERLPKNLEHNPSRMTFRTRPS